MKSNSVIDNLKTRRSVRKYKPQQVSDADLTAILDATTYAPTGKGTQAPIIIAVQNKEDADTLRKLNAQIMGSTTDPYYAAPTILLVLVDKSSTTIVHDGSAVMTYALLAAHSLGLATCWINREKQMFETDEGKALLKKWGFDPEKYIGVAGSSLGYLDGEERAAKPRKENYYTIIK